MRFRMEFEDGRGTNGVDDISTPLHPLDRHGVRSSVKDAGSLVP